MHPCTGCMAHRGSRGLALPFHDHGTRRGEGSASHPGRSLPPGKTQYPLYRRLGGPQGQSGQVQKNLAPPLGFDPRTIQPVASRYTAYATRPTCYEKLKIQLAHLWHILLNACHKITHCVENIRGRGGGSGSLWAYNQ